MHEIIRDALDVALYPRSAAAVYEGPPGGRHAPGNGREHHLVDALRRHAYPDQVILQTSLLRRSGQHEV